ncbi:MAG: leucyl/phenylalanyl-tRNA--protein transferase [Chloroflexi bacterium]|nr:leucyl/phenylalanyl-tRNA--protein transferase [Chloroflexota bacterium]
MIEIPSNFWLNKADTPFPNVNLALNEPNGLIAIGGDLSIDRMLLAYENGIFPWYGEGEPILWYSPNPRMVITPDKLHVSKSLKKILHSSQFRVCIDMAFKEVILQCRTVQRPGQSGTWIDDEMVKSYCQLHKLGYAHSYEVYKNDELVGGLYGVALGRVFFGESMFSLVSNASKVAFAHLLQKSKYCLIDCQIENQHLESLGAFKMPRDLFIQQLKAFV